MQPTRRTWIVAGTTAVLAAWALLLGEPVVLAGVVGLCAWLLANQVRFVWLLEDALADLRVEQRVARSRVVAEETTPVTISVEHSSPLPISLTVSARPPAGADGPAASLSLQAGEPAESEATDVVEVSWPVAGTFAFDAPTCTAADPAGLFTQRFAVGSEPSVTVEPRRPRNVHVGRGGEAITAGFGEHGAGRLGGGLEPEEIRKYVPGDAVRQIDWKATARLDELHVREFEAETDRETVLVVDHRPSLATGPEGETALDYLRQVALAFADATREQSDPLGCLTVGEDGLTGTFTPKADATHQRGIRRHLQGLAPEQEARLARSAAGDSSQGASGGAAPRRSVEDARRGRAEARRRAARLTDDTAFSQTLRPFFDRPGIDLEQVEDEPLLGAVRTAASRGRGHGWIVLFTDDTDREAVREAVDLARRADNTVRVFLAPAVLFAVGGLADLDAAYERYTAFERFRRELDSLDGVRAFEVGPADRLSTVLASGRRARERRHR